MSRLLRRACHAVNLAQARGESLNPRLVERFQRRYDVLVAAGLAYHEALTPLNGSGARGRPRRRPGHNLLLRLSTRRDDVLPFLTDPRVPFSNNLAEQSARMMKLRQKISGGFRADHSARDFSAIRSLISTSKKQDWNLIHTLSLNPDLLISLLRTE
ncbi:hypothetical protein CCP3SC5AM1_2480003 [Gammaproteobacteria bacterium]